MAIALAASLCVVPALAALLWRSGGERPVAALLMLGALALVVMAAGRLALRAAGARQAAPAAWVLGACVSALALNLLAALFGLLAATAFFVWAALVAALAWRLRERSPADPWGPAALLLCAGATLYWCWDLAAVYGTLLHDGVMTTWTDQFIHAAHLSQFGDPRAAGAGAMELAGTPRPLYHYASYLLPAAFARPLDLPGLPLATSLWVPLGFLTLCAGVYTLGAALAGPAGGMASLAALTVLPDAASYGLMNRAFGYYWLMLQVPGGAYATAACLVSLALWLRWRETGARRLLVASAALVLACLFIRVHVFLLAFPAWLVATALAVPALAARRATVLAGAAVALALFVLGYYALVPGATPALAQFLHVIHDVHPALPLPFGYAQLVRDYGAAAGLVGGTLLVLPAALGVFLLLYPASLLLLRRVRPLRLADALPALVLCVFLLLVIAAPVAPNGDPTEFGHRPFVLVYAVFAIWTAAGLASWLGTLRRARAWAWGIAGLACLGAWAALFTSPDARWDEYFWLEPGVPQAGHYIRARSAPGDVLAVQGLETRRVASDPAIQLVALSGVPAYLSRPFIHATRGGAAKRTAEARYAELERIAAEPTMQAALERAGELGIRWYVVPGSSGPRWDAGRRHAAFVAGRIAVYRAERGSGHEQ
ncbi:MAG TPA: hypothetical protein VF211_01555 [Burkholderiales bacterium]